MVVWMGILSDVVDEGGVLCLEIGFSFEPLHSPKERKATTARISSHLNQMCSLEPDDPWPLEKKKRWIRPKKMVREHVHTLR